MLDGVRVGVNVNVDEGVRVLVKVGEGVNVEVDVGVNDKAAMSCSACIVRAIDVELAFAFGVGDNVCVGRLVDVNVCEDTDVAVGVTVEEKIG